MHGGPLGPSGRLPRTVRRALLAIGFTLLVLMLLPNGPTPTAGASARLPPGPGGFVRSLEVPPAASPPPTLPGAVPTGEPRVDAARLALSAPFPARPAPAPANASLPPGAPVTVPPTVVGAFAGTVSGQVYDYTYGLPISGATVIAEPFGATSCLPGLCSNTTSGANGAFSLPTIVGAVALLFTAPEYVGNQTWTDVGRSQSVNLGYVFLLHDGYATGVVETATPDQSPIAGVEVNATSRIGDLSGNPGQITGASGTFDIPVPPVPSEISVTPIGESPAFLANTTYVNVSSYGTVDVGVIHLEGGVPITAELIDRATGRPIAPGTPTQLTYCSRPANICTQPIINETGANVTAWGMPGAASVVAAAVGYVVNTTPVKDLPDTNTTVGVGPIYLVPMAAAEISSNFTGGAPPTGGWPAGNVTAYLCSLDSVEVAVQLVAGGELVQTPCWPRGLPGAVVGNTFPLGTTSLVVGPPLRDAVMIVPANASPPGFPIAEAQSLSPSPEYPAKYANITWANLTPDAVTPIGSVDVSAGDYVAGRVTEPGYNGSLDGAFSVQVCSTDTAGECGASVLSSDLGPPVTGCPSGPSDFCAPAPPGPDQIVVTALGPGTTNVSWVEVPSGCCAQSGVPVSVGTLGLPPAGEYGLLTGTVEARIGGWGSAADPPGDVYGLVEACPVGPAVPGTLAPSCTFGVINATDGTFSMVAASGWDKVTATAAGYQQNWTWVFLNGTNYSGVLELTPNGYLTGTVESAAGGPVNGAVISTCPVGRPNDCTAIASAGTNGQYNGSVPGGAYPWATYMVEAGYPGFVTDWTWLNATAGAIVRVPPLVLPVLPTPNGTSGSPPSVRPFWVTGTVRDGRTGLPVRQAVVGECASGSCTNVNSIASFGGTFNLTWVPGEDQLLVSAAGYVSKYFDLPNTTAASEPVGVLYLSPETWVSGQVLIGPWGSLANVDGLGAPTEVQFCPPPVMGAPPCGVAAPTNTAGFFNTTSYPSGPAGMYLEAIAQGIDAFGSGQGGFSPLVTGVTVNATNFTSVPPVNATLFSGITGKVVDGTGSGGSLNASSAPGFIDVVAQPPSPSFSSFQWTFAITGPSGAYTFFVDVPTNGTLNLTASAIGYRSLRVVANASSPAPGVAPVPAAAMSHDGYLNATVVDAATLAPIPDASVVATVSDPHNVSAFSLGAYTNGSGDVNTTAPAGPTVNVTVDAPGYVGRAFVVAVTGGKTTALGRIVLSEGAPPTGFYLQSERVNTVGVAPQPSAVDPKTGAPLPDAKIEVAAANGTLAAIAYTNDLGQFLVWVPSTPFVAVTMTLNAFDPVTFNFSTAGIGRLAVKYLNTTGAGIVEGRVLVQPNGTPLYDTLVNVCPYGSGYCDYTEEAVGYTNVSGGFWVPGTRGFDQASVQTQQYLANSTPTIAISTEGFYNIGTIDVYAFATVSGVVLGVPGGAPIPGATVSLCSTFGTPYGPCDTSTVTGPAGNFSFQSPPSSYVLVATAPGFNETYRSIVLGAGQQLDVGAILLVADGVVSGRAVSSFNGAPLANSTVIACLTDAPSDCTPFVPGNPDGTFVLEAPPGPVLLTVSAPGFISNYTDIVVPAGGFEDLGDVALAPLAVDIPESLAGTVTAANLSNAPIVGAFVALTVGPQSVSSAVTDSHGAFVLPAPWGTYTLVVSATGFVGVRLPVIVHANLTGFQVSLATRTFLVTGTARDATTGAALAGVEITENGSVLATTGPSGVYEMMLANGSYTFVAQGGSAAGVSYSPLTFLVRVDGGTVVHNVSMAEATARLTGVVVDASSGLPIPGASVSLSGGALGAGLSAVVGVTGGFTFSVAPGTYLLNASAPGYTPASSPVSVPSAGPVDVALSVASFGGPGTPAVTALDLALVGLGVAVVVLAAVLVWRRRPPPPVELPRWTLEDQEG